MLRTVIHLIFSFLQHVSDPGDGVAYRACRWPLCRRAATGPGLFWGSRSHGCRHTRPLGLGLRSKPSPQPLQPVEHRWEQQAGRAHGDLQEDPQETGVQTGLKGGCIYPVGAFIQYFHFRLLFFISALSPARLSRFVSFQHYEVPILHTLLFFPLLFIVEEEAICLLKSYRQMQDSFQLQDFELFLPDSTVITMKLP